MTLPSLNISCPADLGFCAVGEEAVYEITLQNKNRGDRNETKFLWEFREPFKISPSYGTITGRKPITVTLTFLPTEATRYEGTLVCRYGNEYHSIFKCDVSGVSKIPHITLSTEHINFGSIPSRSKASHIVTVHNAAPVPATVSIHSDFDGFKVTPNTISLKPEGSGQVEIKFNPTNFDFYAFANITFSTAGGNSVTLNANAYVHGPKVTIDRTSLNFGKIQSSTVSSTSFKIHNHSNHPIMFEFMIDHTSVFQFNPIQGVLDPNTYKSVRVVFDPEHQIAYYRRVILLIHQHHPIALDVFGSAYNTFNNPPILTSKSIEKNHLVISKGMGRIPVKDLVVPTEKVVPYAEYIANDLTRHACEINYGSHIFDELFTGIDLISMSSSNIEFGKCVRDVSPDRQTITIKNNTDGLVTLYWQRNSDNFVEIEPNVTDIPKQQSVECQIKFKPLLEFQFMGAQLEGFVQFKEMRNKNIVHFPRIPFFLSPFVNGHTMDDVTSFIPTMFTSHKILNFAGAIVGDCNYQTFYVLNKGDCAFKYDVRIIDPQIQDKNAIKSSSAAFSVYPQVGTIRKGLFQIFVVRFSPAQKGSYHAQLFAHINDSPANSFSVSLKGEASVPAVSFSVDGTLFLHPVSLGSSSSQVIKVTNESSVPMSLEWKISAQYSHLLHVTPSYTEIKAKEVVDCLWDFHPDSTGTFNIDVMCNVRALSGSSHSYIASEMLPFIVGPDAVNKDASLFSSLNTVQRYPLTVSTFVTECIVNSKPHNIDFGFVRINSAATSTLSISNHSDSQMHFLLKSSSNLNLLQFTPTDDVLPPRSSREVEVRFTPNTPGPVSDSILCYLINESHIQEGYTLKSLEKLVRKGSASEICKIVGIGCYPRLEVIDVFSPKYSRALMWESSSCNAINSEMNNLGCDSLADELKSFTVDFGFDTIDADPTSISLRFKNVGHIAFNFSINFPNDVSIDPEYWALPDEIDPNQLKQDQIMQAKLFRVSEKKFYLEPNQCCDVCFTYQHKFIESHVLPVVVSVQNGRIIRLILKGTTLNPSVPYIVNIRPTFELQPVPIGSIDPPVQLLSIFNPVLVDTDYRIDLTQIQELNELNHDFDIFKCLNPVGSLKPRSYSDVQWVFKPLEAIEYEVSVLCTVSNGNTFTVNLRGRGVHPDHEECEVEWPKAPPKSLLVDDVSPVKLSEQYLMLGDMPVFSKQDRIIYINNTTEKQLTFNADIKDDIVKMEPRSGSIGPHGSTQVLVTVHAPSHPLIYRLMLPIFFSEPAQPAIDEMNAQEENENDEQILHADPPIGAGALRSSKIGGLKRLRSKPEEWKSVSERTLEATQKISNGSSKLFSTHIGKREDVSPDLLLPKNFCMQFIDIALNCMSKTEYRDRYGSIDAFYFCPENVLRSPLSGQRKEEVSNMLTNYVDEILADEQVRRISMNTAKVRSKHVPLFSQLYKENPSFQIDDIRMKSLENVNKVQEALHEIIDEIIEESNQGTFQLFKDIIQVSGFKVVTE